MNILYYPEINIPRTEWAIRAFLYYDEVAAIVPYKYNMEPNSYEPFMREVRKHSKKCTFYTLRFGCSFAAVNTIKPQLL